MSQSKPSTSTWDPIDCSLDDTFTIGHDMMSLKLKLKLCT
jgi:hypothetical protein